jgi:hypothetical protein
MKGLRATSNASKFASIVTFLMILFTSFEISYSFAFVKPSRYSQKCSYYTLVSSCSIILSIRDISGRSKPKSINSYIAFVC